uniref:HACL1 n=1 Tax=Arundo donax TaxID=35708 RepID=A0A0A9D9H7_ARUDO
MYLAILTIQMELDISMVSQLWRHIFSIRSSFLATKIANRSSILGGTAILEYIQACWRTLLRMVYQMDI